MKKVIGDINMIIWDYRHGRMLYNSAKLSIKYILRTAYHCNQISEESMNNMYYIYVNKLEEILWKR